MSVRVLKRSSEPEREIVPEASPLVVYEVTITVRREIAQRFEAWLPEHAAHVILCPGFMRAAWFREAALPDAPNSDPTAILDTVCFTVHYTLRDMKSLEIYLEKYAPRLRKEMLEAFGTQAHATRRALVKQGAFVRP